MFGNRGGESKRFDDERVVIGLFPYASGARRAVHALHAHNFTSDQISCRVPRAGRFSSRGRRSARADTR